jgi:hypothetical protein
MRVVRAHVPMIVGIASLIGVDTFLSEKLPRRPVRLGESALGAGDLLYRPAALDPRLEGDPT